ncbi:dicarboxylate/amino acid:cation symporter [Geminocystis sp.]|uniref:dicarboxylate/amino acid:cation symporter n=1 Tax=Geminocystis sp. TaxID=2664100 RepID=UPI003592F264
MNLSTFILIALGIGIAFGTFINTTFPANVSNLDHYFLLPVGESFLRLIQFLVMPIVFSSLIMGFSRIQNASQVGRYTAKLLSSYVITTAISVSIGMGVAWFLQPGNGLSGFQIPETMGVSEPPSIIDWLVSLIPINPLEALSEGNLLQIIFSAAIFAVGIQLAGEKSKPFVNFMESVYNISEKSLSIILYTAPLGVFALISSVIATQGIGLILKLLVYVLGLLCATLLMTGFYVIILVILKEQPVKFFSSVSEALILAFGTASSNAALPVLLQNIQEKYGLNEEIASFAIPLGTALKRDGAAILQGFNALFIAQIYHVPITTSLITAIALSSLLVSFSTPGVPGSALITMATVLSASGLPLEGIAIVAGVDRLTDGFKTVINLIGNSVNAIALSHWEQSPQNVNLDTVS